MATFIQQLINGLTIGGMYSLIALGYTMVYGILQLINFAHGEIFMIGAYIGLVILSTMVSSEGAMSLPLPLILTITFLGAMLGAALVGIIVERVAYRPLRKAPRLSLLITALGVSIVLQNAVMLIFGAKEQVVPDIFPMGGWEVGGAFINYLQVFIIAFAIVLMVALHFLIRKTKLGKAMRATALDIETAGLMGINPNRIIMITFALGSALGAAAGVLFGLYYSVINFYIGYQAGIKAFTAAVLGGIGNIPGAMIGGLLLGVMEAMGAGYISAQWKDVIAFMVLVLVLLFKPSGLFGENVQEKV